MATADRHPSLPSSRRLPKALAALAGLACLACCLLPVLIAAGLLGGASWNTLGQLLPAVAIALILAAGGSWWTVARRRRRSTGCGDGCACGRHTLADTEAQPA